MGFVYCCGGLGVNEIIFSEILTDIRFTFLAIKLARWQNKYFAER